jgi:hypothetical protein
MENYRLFIQKVVPNAHKVRAKTKHFYFSILDMDKGLYPNNFICNMPKITANMSKSVFAQCFENQPLETIAEKLLLTAKQEYDDEEIQGEIDDRLVDISRFRNRTF